MIGGITPEPLSIIHFIALNSLIAFEIWYGYGCNAKKALYLRK